MNNISTLMDCRNDARHIHFISSAENLNPFNHSWQWSFTTQICVQQTYFPLFTCFVSMFILGSSLTSGGIWWSELQRVAQHVVVVPHIKLVVSRIVVHRGNVLVWVRERDVDRFLLCVVGVVGVHHQVTTCFAVIVLVDGAHCVQHAASHESVGRHPLVEAGFPGAFKAQCVGVDLQTENTLNVASCIKVQRARRDG